MSTSLWERGVRGCHRWSLARGRTRARRRGRPRARCRARTEVETARMHGYHERTVADMSIDARRVLVCVRMRRLVCPTRGCRQTFREQLPGVLEGCQRRTPRVTSRIGAVVRELAGRPSARVLETLLRLPVPVRRAPRVLEVDDFALRRRHHYATVLVDAESCERVDVLPGREADALEEWLRTHAASTPVLAYSSPSRSPDPPHLAAPATSRLCQGRSRLPRHHPDQAALSFNPTAETGSWCRSPTSTRTNSPSWRKPRLR